MTLPNAQSSFCSSRSRMVDEALYGTAGRYDCYIIIEWNEKFPDKALGIFEGATFSGEDADRWRALINDLPNPRVQLIRQRGYSIDEDGLSVFFAVTHETNPLLYEFRLEKYTDIFNLDFKAMLTGEIAYHPYLREDPLYIICTNGSHDPCCARHGLPVYKAMSMTLGKPDVWQTSHIGGHRFAGTGIFFPHGIFYGGMNAENSPELLNDYQQGRLDLDYYRGRVCYSKVQQAGEYFLRRETGVLDLPAFRLLETDAFGDDLWRLQFEAFDDGAVHTLDIQQSTSTWANPMSCSSDEAESVPVYELVHYQVQERSGG
ncbi:MAG: sucrase ferredoxin [Aggregatilineales bacterium]